jgi:quinol monooxygenase YgiN
MIIVHGHALVREDRLDQALALSLAHVRRSRQEAGCIAHGVSQDAEQPARLVFVEQWASMAALQAHFALPASRAFVKDLGGLVQAPPAMVIYRADDEPVDPRGGR